MKEGEGQPKNIWTQTTEWGWPEGRGEGVKAGGGWQSRGDTDICNSVINRNEE